jgi:hypothetical protein
MKSGIAIAGKRWTWLISGVERFDSYVLGDRPVKCLGYGAMQLSGPGIDLELEQRLWVSTSTVSDTPPG